MRRATLYGALTVTGILAAGALVYFSSVKKTERPEAPEAPRTHYFNDASVPLDRIRIKTFYFIPKEKADEHAEAWQSAMAQTINEIIKFHEFQFRAQSFIFHDPYPDPIIGESESSFYDGREPDSTARGNPLAAGRIDEEMQRRFPGLLRVPEREFLVKVYVYEGPGLAAVGNAILFSRDYLTQSGFDAYRSSLLYHELAHTFGAPEGYDPETQATSREDIMGAGRFRPINITYLGSDIKTGMGLQ